jgi:hypothetical protein
MVVHYLGAFSFMSHLDQDDAGELWKKMIESRLAAIRQEVSKNQGIVAPQAIRQIKDLNLLFEIQKSLAPTAPAPRWPIAVAFLTTLLVLSILFFGHVRSTVIDLDATVSEIGFTVDDAAHFPLPNLLSRVAIAGVTLDQQETWACDVSHAGVGAFTFQAVGATTPQNAISVSPLELPRGTIVILTHTGNAFHQQLKLTFPDVEYGHPIVLTARGDANLKSENCDATSVASPFDHLTFHAVAHETLDLSFDPLEEDLPTPVDILASKVSFFNVETSSASAAEYALPLSTIYSGSLFFDSVGGRERKLREGERIEFSGFKGVVHVLHAQKDRFRTRITGEVADVRSDESDSTLKPTYFEYLTVNQGLPALWGAVIYCFGLFIVVKKWWNLES